MSHLSSRIILRGGEYREGYEPAAGQTAVEVRYTPSAGLTDEQVNRNIAKARRLIDKLYHLEAQPEE